MKNSNTFGDRLRELRKGRGINLGDMAERLDIAPSYLSDVELGRRHPFRVDAIERCAQIMQLDAIEARDLIAAASVQRGAIELPVDPGNQQAVEAGAALMCAWPTLSTENYLELSEFIKRVSTKK